MFEYNGKKTKINCPENRKIRKVMQILAAHKKLLLSSLRFVLPNSSKEVDGEHLVSVYRDKIIKVVNIKEELTQVKVKEHAEHQSENKMAKGTDNQNHHFFKSTKHFETINQEKKTEQDEIQWSGSCVFCDTRYTDLKHLVKHYCTEHLWDVLIKEAIKLKNNCVECSMDKSYKVEMVMHAALHHNLLNNYLVKNGHPTLPTAQLSFRHEQSLSVLSAKRENRTKKV